MSETTRQSCPTSRRGPRRRAGAAAASVPVALLAWLVLVAPSHAQIVGDFGRLERGFLNDELVPLLDRNRRGTNGQVVDGFNLTDAEVEMRDRTWRFLVDPHPSGWVWPTDGEDSTDEVPKYYRWLTRQRYASSRVRYNTIADDVTADLGSLPAAFDVICVLIEEDRQRGVAISHLERREPQMDARRQRRLYENGSLVGRFAHALAFRYASYSYALDHLLVETPHAEAIEADARLTDLAIWVDRAGADAFCADGWAPHPASRSAIPGRVLIEPPDEGPYRK